MCVFIRGYIKITAFSGPSTGQPDPGYKSLHQWRHPNCASCISLTASEAQPGWSASSPIYR